MIVDFHRCKGTAKNPPRKIKHLCIFLQERKCRENAEVETATNATFATKQNETQSAYNYIIKTCNY